jgi:hypothetical protein
VHDRSLTAAPLKLCEGALAVLARWSTRALTPSDRATLAATTGRIRCWLELQRGKEQLAKGDFRSARMHLVSANRSCPSWKLRIALVALRIAPAAVRRIQHERDRRRQQRSSRVR